MSWIKKAKWSLDFKQQTTNNNKKYGLDGSKIRPHPQAFPETPGVIEASAPQKTGNKPLPKPIFIHFQPSLLSDLPPWGGSKVDWPWHKGQFRPLDVELCWFHPMCVENMDVSWRNSCWLGNAATPLVASTAECERPAATATWAMSHQVTLNQYHHVLNTYLQLPSSVLDTIAPRAKQQSEAKVARNPWVVVASWSHPTPRSTRDLPGFFPLPSPLAAAPALGLLCSNLWKRMQTNATIGNYEKLT